MPLEQTVNNCFEPKDQPIQAKSLQISMGYEELRQKNGQLKTI